MKKVGCFCLCLLMVFAFIGCAGQEEYTYDPTEEFSDVEWPDSVLAQRLPTPEMTYGEIKHEQEESFSIDFGNVTREQYNNYVKECKEAGYTVDYHKSNTVYWAYDAEGYYLYVSYDDEYNIMGIDTREPEKEKDTAATTTTKTTKTTTSQKTTTSTASKKSDGGLSADFKAAMDSYEQFMDEYIAFMKKYSDNPSDLGLLVDYARFMGEYATFCEEFAAWEDEDLSDAELAYYLAVQTRVNKKLLEVAD